jgi:gliding motility-associated-like protein
VCPSIFSEEAIVQTDAASEAGNLFYSNGVAEICNQGVKPTISVSNNVGSNIYWQVSDLPASNFSTNPNNLTYINVGQTGNFINELIDNSATGINSSFRYYRAVVKNGVCPVSVSAPIELEVIPTPIITNFIGAERCGPGTLNLTASTNLGEVNWFDNMTGGTSLYSGSTYTTGNLSNKLNYFYASGLFRGCASLSRTEVLAEVLPIPSIILPVASNTNCGPGFMELGASATDNGLVQWYLNPTGGSAISTGNKYTTPVLNSSATYYVDAASRGCTTVSRVPVEATIFEVPIVAEVADFFNICAGLKLNYSNIPSLGLKPYSYSFYTSNANVSGQTDGNILGIKGGLTNVYFSVTDKNGCKSSNTNTFQIKTFDPISPSRFNYQAFYKDNFVIPTKVDSGYMLYNWQPDVNLNFSNKPNPVFNGENTTDYVLIRTDTTSKCTVADNYHIDVTRDFIFDLPNAFTPNFDGLNDVIKAIKNAGIKKINSLSIFNRYGTRVCCTTNEIENGWNGTLGGKSQDTDGYYWVATFETKTGQILTKRGSFLLLK